MNYTTFTPEYIKDRIGKATQRPIIAGQSYIPVTGKVLDEEFLEAC